MNIFIYLVIFLAKMLEVSIGVFRLLLTTKGFRKQAALIVFFEQLIWIINISLVISSITDDPVRAIAYAAGFGCGLYFGSWLEGKVGLGNIKAEIILEKNEALPLANIMRKSGFAVTILDATGMEGHFNAMIISYIPRKRRKIVANLASKYPKAVVTFLDVRPVQGGFGTTKKT